MARAGFLNGVYSEWFTWDSGHRLPFRYNAQRTVLLLPGARARGYWAAAAPHCVVHYCSSPKPWQCTSSRNDLDLLWWCAYTGNALPLPAAEVSAVATSATATATAKEATAGAATAALAEA